ncbi:MAG: DNA translocase FtsK 4TM domain-containing protein [Thiotrichaceae bacterium]|nr:DNA translocase FtsK 4TM domain-containing protein [Thiotrichaceae bacterium]
MSQARRNRRFNTPADDRPIKHGLREILLIFFCFVALYLLVCLFTYNPLDPGWSHSGTQVAEVKNKGGVAGALFADVFLYLFGYFAYLFPMIVGYVGFLVYHGRHYDIIAEPKSTIIPSIGFILTLSAGCGLAIVHFSSETVFAGGILGRLVGQSLQSVFSHLGATLLLLAVFLTGVTLLTGLSWMKLMDFLGFHTLRLMPVLERFLGERFFPWAGVVLKNIANAISYVARFVFGKAKERWETRKNNKEYEEDDEYFQRKEGASRQRPAEAQFSHVALENADDAADSMATPAKKTELVPTLTEVIAPPPASDAAILPSLDLLSNLPQTVELPNLEKLSQDLLSALNSLEITTILKTMRSGPVLSSFEVQLAKSLSVGQLEELGTQLAAILRLEKVRVVENIPNLLHIEIAHAVRQEINLHDLISTPEYQQHPSRLPLALGKEISGQAVVIDLTRIPHLLLAASHGDEKANAVHSLLLSLLYKSTPQQLRLLLIDNANRDLSLYENLPHLLLPVIHEAQQIPPALQWCEQEMERRYRLMANRGARNIESYNQMLSKVDANNPLLAGETGELPYIVIVMQEIAEIMMSHIHSQAEDFITRLVQKARAAGIHLILTTQYLSVNVITGSLKASIPTRIAFQVNTKSESRTILGQMGAEMLLGQGDMLYMTAGTGLPVRVHGVYVAESEVSSVVTDLSRRAQAQYIAIA